MAKKKFIQDILKVVNDNTNIKTDNVSNILNSFNPNDIIDKTSTLKSVTTTLNNITFLNNITATVSNIFNNITTNNLISSINNKISSTQSSVNNIINLTNNIISATSTNISSTNNKNSTNKPIKNIDGLIILPPAQYKDVYYIGNWGGLPAMLTNEKSNQMVWVDSDFTTTEFKPKNYNNPYTKNDNNSSNFGIGIHQGNPGKQVSGNWTDDCNQTFSNNEDLKEFFDLCNKHKELYGNSFTYTIASKNDWSNAYQEVVIDKKPK